MFARNAIIIFVSVLQPALSILLTKIHLRRFSADITTNDPLDFKFRGTTYKERLKADEKKSGVKEAMLIGNAFIKGRGVILAVMEPNFLMGSMGFVVGEKLCVAVDMAIEESLPLVVVSCSGGARMHEGVVSLGQMAKTSAALAKFDEAKGLYHFGFNRPNNRRSDSKLCYVRRRYYS